MKGTKTRKPAGQLAQVSDYSNCIKVTNKNIIFCLEICQFDIPVQEARMGTRMETFENFFRLKCDLEMKMDFKRNRSFR